MVLIVEWLAAECRLLLWPTSLRYSIGHKPLALWLVPDWGIWIPFRLSDLYYGGEAVSVEQPQSFTCPICGKMGFTEMTLQEHVAAEHTDASSEVVRVRQHCLLSCCGSFSLEVRLCTRSDQSAGKVLVRVPFLYKSLLFDKKTFLQSLLSRGKNGNRPNRPGVAKLRLAGHMRLLQEQVQPAAL